MNLFTPASEASDLTLFMTLPPKPLNWTSPRSLTWSTLRNSIGRDHAPIGHVNVLLNCQTPNEFGVKSFLTGMSRADKKLANKIVMKSKMGLGTMFFDFDGKLDSAKDAFEDIQAGIQNNRVNALKINISENQCQELMRFATEWIKQGSFKHYGSGHDASKGEGAGCTAFATEFVRRIGLQDIMKTWNRQVWIPKKLVGHVRMWKLLLTANQWGKPNHEDSYPLDLPDPELMYDWVASQLKPAEGKTILENPVYTLDASQNDSVPAIFETSYKHLSKQSQKEEWEKIDISGLAEIGLL